MSEQCSPDHDEDPILVHVNLTLEMCADLDPVAGVRELPDGLLDLVETVPGLHGSRLVILIGSLLADGQTDGEGGRTMIQLMPVEDDDEAEDGGLRLVDETDGAERPTTGDP